MAEIRTTYKLKPLSSFVGRDADLKCLDEVRQYPGAHIVAVYGRRRVGTTILMV